MDTTANKPLAVVTGASSGIGYELARQFATNGFDVIVAAEDDAIATAAAELRELGAQVQDVQVDLATDEGVDALYGAIASAGRPAPSR
jgi:short-subunit dehydrogenase